MCVCVWCVLDGGLQFAFHWMCNCPSGAARVVCLMTHQEITEGVSRLCQLVATPLQQCATPTNSKGDPSIWLDRLAAIFKYVSMLY